MRVPTLYTTIAHRLRWVHPIPLQPLAVHKVKYDCTKRGGVSLDKSEDRVMCIPALWAGLAPTGQPLATGCLIHLGHSGVTLEGGWGRRGGEDRGRNKDYMLSGQMS